MKINISIYHIDILYSITFIVNMGAICTTQTYVIKIDDNIFKSPRSTQRRHAVCVNNYHIDNIDLFNKNITTPTLIRSPKNLKKYKIYVTSPSIVKKRISFSDC